VKITITIKPMRVFRAGLAISISRPRLQLLRSQGVARPS
jgi:hypothetical protein